MEYFKILTNLQTLEKYKFYDLFVYSNGTYTKYKSKNYIPSSIKISPALVDNLYIKMHDRISAVRDRQRVLNKELTRSISIDLPKAKEALKNIVDNMLSEPKTLVLREARVAIDAVVNEFLENPKIIENLTYVALHDYSTSLHLTNCMLLCMGYAYHNKFSEKEMKLLGLAGLMHDVGKVEVPDYILQASRKLTDEEFDIIKKHPVDSKQLLVNAKFESVVIRAAYEHHERLDGSGYPSGKKAEEISDYGKILAIIDIYEALTHWRPYKEALNPLDALKIIKEDVDRGKIDKEYFINFNKSIVGTSKEINKGEGI